MNVKNIDDGKDRHSNKKPFELLEKTIAISSKKGD
jgi:hypothetical protein